MSDKTRKSRQMDIAHSKSLSHIFQSFSDNRLFVDFYFDVAWHQLIIFVYIDSYFPLAMSQTKQRKKTANSTLSPREANFQGSGMLSCDNGGGRLPVWPIQCSYKYTPIVNPPHLHTRLYIQQVAATHPTFMHNSLLFNFKIINHSTRTIRICL